MADNELILYNTEDGTTTNRIIMMYLGYTEDGARHLRHATMAERSDKLDTFLSFNKRNVLRRAGRLRMDVAQKLAAERFEVFDANRRAAAVLAAGETGIAQLEEMEKAAKGRKKGDANA